MNCIAFSPIFIIEAIHSVRPTAKLVGKFGAFLHLLSEVWGVVEVDDHYPVKLSRKQYRRG